MKSANRRECDLADEFCREDVPHSEQRRALADRFGHGGFTWNDKWLAVKEIEDLLSALIDQKFGRQIDIAPKSAEPLREIKDGT